MKFLKKTVTIVLMLIMTGAYAQEVSQESMVKTFTVTQGDIKTPYEVTVKTVEKAAIELADKDAGKKEQKRVITEETVTRMIYIDKGADAKYEKVIKLSYTKEKEDDFTVRMIDDGFVFTVYGKDLTYYFNNNDYKVNMVDDNFFKIVQM